MRPISSFARDFRMMTATEVMLGAEQIGWQTLNRLKGGEYMDTWIQQTYPTTENADLIRKWFGYWFTRQEGRYPGDIDFYRFLIKGREQELLELAKKLEEEEKAKKK